MLEKPCLLDYLDNVDVIVGLENVTEYKVKVHGMWNITVFISPGCVRLVKFISFLILRVLSICDVIFEQFMSGDAVFRSKNIVFVSCQKTAHTYFYMKKFLKYRNNM